MKQFKYYPELILLFSFLLCILHLDLIEFTQTMSRDFRYIEPLFLIVGSIEGFLFCQIIFANFCLYFLVKKLKNKFPDYCVAMFMLCIAFLPPYINLLRGMSGYSLIIPFGFLLLALAMKRFGAFGITSTTVRFRKPLMLILLLFAASQIALILKLNYERQRSGRASGMNSEELSLTLKTKKYIYSLTNGLRTQDDPFTNLHGRAINRMRYDEMNPEQTEAYFGLYRALTHNVVQIQPAIKEALPDSSWLFQLRTERELQLNPQTPYLLTEIKTDALPQNMIIKYFNMKLEGIEKVEWKNGGYVLPLAFLSHPEATKFVRLEFEMKGGTNKYLIILMNHFYKMLQVKLNSKVQAIYENYDGLTDLQTQMSYKIPENKETARVVIELKIDSDSLPNYSRLDIFSTPYALPSEVMTITD